MKKDSTKNSAPIAPTSAEPSNATGAKPVVAKPLKGTLIKKKNTAAGDPYTQAKPSRKFVTATGGARYGIRVGVGAMQVAPEAGATQGNGRLFKSATNRTSPNFKAGSADLM
jgi:hypothetical protein